MFSFFKTNKEKHLIKLGYKTLIDSYYKKVKDKEWTKTELKKAINDLFEQKKAIIGNAENVNVSTRQSFVDDEVLIALNLQNIQDEFVDYDFIYSTLLYEFKNHNRIHTKAIVELKNHLLSKYPNTEVTEHYIKEIKDKDNKELINIAITDMNSENVTLLLTVFNELKNRA